MTLTEEVRAPATDRRIHFQARFCNLLDTSRIRGCSGVLSSPPFGRPTGYLRGRTVRAVDGGRLLRGTRPDRGKGQACSRRGTVAEAVANPRHPTPTQGVTLDPDLTVGSRWRTPVASDGRRTATSLRRGPSGGLRLLQWPSGAAAPLFVTLGLTGGGTIGAYMAGASLDRYLRG